MEESATWRCYLGDCCTHTEKCQNWGRTHEQEFMNFSHLRSLMQEHQVKSAMWCLDHILWLGKCSNGQRKHWLRCYLILLHPTIPCFAALLSKKYGWKGYFLWCHMRSMELLDLLFMMIWLEEIVIHIFRSILSYFMMMHIYMDASMICI